MDHILNKTKVAPTITCARKDTSRKQSDCI
jgi:hypothetical protein